MKAFYDGKRMQFSVGRDEWVSDARWFSWCATCQMLKPVPLNEMLLALPEEVMRDGKSSFECERQWCGTCNTETITLLQVLLTSEVTKAIWDILKRDDG